MGLFDNLSGLGLAAGAVAGGAVRGELAGQQSQIKLQQAQQMMNYRNAMLQSMMNYRNRGLDIREQGNQIRMAAPYIHALADPGNVDYFKRNPGIAADFRARANGEVVGGDSNFDEKTGTLHLPNGKVYGAAGPIGLGGAGGADAGAGTGGTGAGTGGTGADEAPVVPTGPGAGLTWSGPIDAPLTDAGNPANYDPTGAYTGPRAQPAPFDTVPPVGPSGVPSGSLSGALLGPSNLGQVRKSVFGAPQLPFQYDTATAAPTPTVFSGEPAGGLPFASTAQFQQTVPKGFIGPLQPGGSVFAPAKVASAPTAAPGTGPASATVTPAAAGGATPGTTAAAAPLDPSQDPSSLGYQGYLPYETDKNRFARLSRYAQIAGLDIRQVMAGAQLPGIIARGQLGGMKVLEEPERFGTAQAGAEAGISLKQAQTKALQDYAPLHDAQVISLIQHVRTADELAALRTRLDAKYKDSLLALGQQRVNIARAGQQTKASLADARINQINATLAGAAGKTMSADDKEILTTGAAMLRATKRTATGSSVPLLSDADQAKWESRVDNVLSRYNTARQNPGAGVTPGGGVGTAPPTGSLTAGTRLKSPLTNGEIQKVKAEITNGSFDSWMNSPQLQDSNIRLRAKTAYQKITGNPWVPYK